MLLEDAEEPLQRGTIAGVGITVCAEKRGQMPADGGITGVGQSKLSKARLAAGGTICGGGFGQESFDEDLSCFVAGDFRGKAAADEPRAAAGGDWLYRLELEALEDDDDVAVVIEELESGRWGAGLAE